MKTSCFVLLKRIIGLRL